PLLVEARLLQGLAEGGRVWLVKDHAIGRKVGLKAGVELEYVRALGDARIVDVLGHNSAEIVRDGLISALVRQKPETIPHMVCDRAILLHLEELCSVNDCKRVFLAFHDLGLKG